MPGGYLRDTSGTKRLVPGCLTSFCRGITYCLLLRPPGRRQERIRGSGGREGGSSAALRSSCAARRGAVLGSVSTPGVGRGVSTQNVRLACGRQERGSECGEEHLFHSMFKFLVLDSKSLPWAKAASMGCSLRRRAKPGERWRNTRVNQLIFMKTRKSSGKNLSIEFHVVGSWTALPFERGKFCEAR